MSPVPTIAEFATIACLFLIFIAVYDARNALVNLVEVMKDLGNQEDEDEDEIDCPWCRQFPLEWRENEPDVGDCFNCDKVYQNVNTKAEPHLRELKGGKGEFNF